MYQVQGSKRFVVGALVMSSALIACDNDKQAEVEKPVVVAQVTPADSPEPMTDTNVTRPKLTNVKYEDATAVFRKGHYPEAADMFVAYVTEHPNDGRGQYMLGLSAWKSGDRGTAVTALTKAVELDSSSTKARTNLAQALTDYYIAEATVTRSLGGDRDLGIR